MLFVDLTFYEMSGSGGNKTPNLDTGVQCPCTKVQMFPPKNLNPIVASKFDYVHTKLYILRLDINFGKVFIL